MESAARLDFRVGTAGWSIAKQYDAAVPKGGSHLARYAARLNAVEINTAFYRPHRRDTYVRWAATVPAGFRFAVKLPKIVSHGGDWSDAAPHLDRFAGEVAGLGDKLGVVLVQLPPRRIFEPAAASALFAALRACLPCALACEPRHPSWFSAEAEALLDAARVARVAADPPPVPGAEVPGGWDGLVYLRLHGSPQIYYSDYNAPALAAIAARLSSHRQTAPTWCVFDNTAAFHALGNALTVTAACAAP